MKSKVFSNQKGITLVVLVIICMVLFILTGVTVGTYVNYIKKSKVQKAEAELQTISHAIGERYMTYLTTKDSSLLIGTDASSNSDFLNFKSSLTNIGLNLDSIEDYYLLTDSHLKSLNIRNADSTDKFIVNYKTREVINLTKFKNLSELKKDNVAQVYYNPNN